MDVPQCRICYRTFKEERFLLSHQRQFVYCRNALALLRDLELDDDVIMHDVENTEPDLPGLDDPNTTEEADLDLDGLLDDFVVNLPRLPALSANNEPPPTTVTPPAPPPRTPPEEAVTIDTFAGAAKVVRQETPIMKRWYKRHGHADNPYHPFKNKVDWEIGRWAKLEGPGATSLDRLLGFESVSQPCQIEHMISSLTR